MPEAVAAVFASYPPVLRERLLALRELVLETAARTRGVGAIEEDIRWGAPSFLTASKSGSTVRLDRVRGTDDRYAVFFTCTTSLVETFRRRYGDRFRYVGNRAIEFHVDDPVPVDALGDCIALALRYHLDRGRHGRGSSEVGCAEDRRTGVGC